jgi:histone deacetylase 1/2
MSIVTGKYYDIPVQENGFGHYDCGTPLTRGTKRKFFQSVMEWDDVSVVDASVNLRTDMMKELGFSSIHGLAGAIERGAQDLDEDVEDVVEGDGVDDEDQEEDQEEEDDDVEMSVDS